MASDQNSNKNPNQSDEIDMVQLFQMIGRAINRFFDAIGNFFKAIGNLFLSFLLFIRRKFIYFLIGMLIGGGIGLYMHVTTEYTSVYKSSMVIESGLSVGPQLYGVIDYLNSLTNTENKSVLADIFEISEEKADLLEKFKVTPIKSNSDILFLYNQKVLSKDTSQKRILPFGEFKSHLENKEYPRQEINIYAKQKDLFSHLETPLLKLLNNSAYLESQKLLMTKNIDEYSKYIRKAIDSVNVALREYLAKENPSTAFYFDKKYKDIKDNGLLGQYNNFLKELNDLNNKKTQYLNVFNVIKPLSPFGKEVNFLRSNFIVRGLLIGFLLTLIIFSAIEFNKYLSAMEIKRN